MDPIPESARLVLLIDVYYLYPDLSWLVLVLHYNIHGQLTRGVVHCSHAPRDLANREDIYDILCAKLLIKRFFSVII